MKYHFGDKIRAVREKKEYTLKYLAEKAGVSDSLISQIERNRVSPAIETLLNIAEALDIDLEYLFADYKKSKKVVISNEGKRKIVATDGVVYEQISRTTDEKARFAFETYIIRIQAGSKSGSAEYGHPGKETGYIMEGKAEFITGNDSYILKKGDSVSFDSDIPHILKNIGDKELIAFWAVTPPKSFMDKI